MQELAIGPVANDERRWARRVAPRLTSPRRSDRNAAGRRGASRPREGNCARVCVRACVCALASDGGESMHLHKYITRVHTMLVLCCQFYPCSEAILSYARTPCPMTGLPPSMRLCTLRARLPVCFCLPCALLSAPRSLRPASLLLLSPLATPPPPPPALRSFRSFRLFVIATFIFKVSSS